MKFRTLAGSWFVLTLAFIVLVLTGAQFQASPAQADDTTWAVRTEANAQGADRTSYGYTIRPGETISDGLVIVNRSEKPLDLGVYASDGFTTDSGGFDLQPGGSEKKSLGSWVLPQQERVTVNPNESVTVPFTVTVPSNATPGDYAGGIVTSMAGDAPGAQAQGVTVDRRLGIRMTLRVDGPLKPTLAIDDPHLVWSGGLNPFAGGETEVEYTIRNTGNTVIGSLDEVTVGGPFGWFPVTAENLEKIPSLLPGESWTQKVKLSSVPPLMFLTASTTVTPSATDAAGSSSPLPTVTVTSSGWAVPWTLLVIIVAIILLVIFGLRFRRGRKEKQKAKEDERVKEAVAEALANS